MQKFDRDAEIDFNSHARVGRDDLDLITLERCNENFNSHARVGRDLWKTLEVIRPEISTHTPV